MTGVKGAVGGNGVGVIGMLVVQSLVGVNYGLVGVVGMNAVNGAIGLVGGVFGMFGMVWAY